MKKIFSFSFIGIVLLTVVVTPAFAIERPAADTMHTGSTGAGLRQEKMEARTEKITDNLQARADQEISRRLESLQKLITRINEFKKLSASQKTSLTTQVQAQITSLTALQAKIKADTDPATVKTDVQSIIGSYRIYALFVPQIQLLGAADRLLTTSDEMSSHAAILGTKITEAQTKGQNVTDLQTLLSDMNTKIADAKTQGQNAINAVTPLTPDGYPGNKTTLQSAREMVVAGVKDLNMARQDARKIIVGLLKFGKLSTTTPTVTVTP